MTSRPPEPPATGAPGLPLPRTESTLVPEWVSALTTARLSAGASLEAVSARTRVREGVLRDLEAGRLASSGGTVYARGHLRSVAQALGVDPRVLLAPFDEETGAPQPVADPPHLAVEAPVPVRSGPRWGAALVAALAILAALLVVGSLRSERHDVVGPAQAPAPTAAARVVPRPAARRPVPVAGARLGLRAVTGSSWVRVSGPAGVVFEGVLASGQAPRQFADRATLDLLVGNAGALEVSCAGHRLAPAGRTGAVSRFTCGSGGLARA